MRDELSLAERQAQLIARFSVIEDPQERLAAIASRGRKWGGLHEAERTDANRVQGCVSRVWLVGTMEDGRCRFRVDADSPLVKGLVSLLCELYDGATPAEVVATEPEIFEALGISRQLSPTRLNGLAAVRNCLREFARNALPA